MLYNNVIEKWKHIYFSSDLVCYKVGNRSLSKQIKDSLVWLILFSSI